MQMKVTQKVIVYTDGSCIANPGPIGFAYISTSSDGKHREFSDGDTSGTNNRAELLAVIAALRDHTDYDEIEIHSDSEYVVRGVNEWSSGWIRRNWRKVQNVDLWKTLLSLLTLYRGYAFKHVRGHSGVPLNEEADRLACLESQKHAAMATPKG